MVIEYQLHPRSAYMYRGPRPSVRQPQPAYVPWVFRRHPSRERGSRPPPVLPYRRGPLRWALSWACRSYMSAVLRGSPFRRAIAWQFLITFASLKWAHSYVWWVKHVTEAPAE